MQPNQWQQPNLYNSSFQQLSFPGAPQQNMNPSYLPSQGTGFPGQQQPMQTGFGQQQQQQRQPQSVFPSQQTGGGNLAFLNQPPPSSFRPMASGVMPQMTGYPGGGASGIMSQSTGFQGGMMSQPTGMGMMGGGGGGLMSQPTGMGMGLRAQPTGVQDPRLQSMMQSFMPSNLSQPFAASGAPQFNSTPQNQPLAQTFQSLLQNPSVRTPKVPWTLSRQEKKDYDQIFRVWEKGDGFISGETAREVFGQAGLNGNDLMKIWTLSDVDNRGKLNLPEFHVAMGLIYRALNGNDIPDKLPEELVPASMRDIDTTVSFMRDLLKHDASTRSNTASPSYGSSGAAVPTASARDATNYKHDDATIGTYRPNSRHIDRKSVRYAGEESGAEISDLRRQLGTASAYLDRSDEDTSRKTAEDDELEQEADDLKYRVLRIQEDIEYVSKGRRSTDKDEERRKLERELLYLMHEKLPELERRQKHREEEKSREERAGVRARDKRNDTHGRYGGSDDRNDGRDKEHDWLKGSYDRPRDRDRSQERNRDREFYRDDNDRDSRRDRERERDREYRPRSPPSVRSPPPEPAVSAPTLPAPPKPTTQAAAAPSTKNMTPEERTAFIREQAQRRIQDRLKALGVETAPAEQPAVDKTVEDRLAREKREAEERSAAAEKEQEARESARQARLHGTSSPQPKDEAKSIQPDAPKSILKKGGGPPAPPAPRGKQPPAPPAPRAKGTQSTPAAAPAPPTPSEEEDPEEVAIRQREAALQKTKEDRRKRLADLERQEEEERQADEARQSAKSARSAPAESFAPPPPPPAPAPPPPANEGYNPFRKTGAAAAPPASSSPAASGGSSFNPFFGPIAAAVAVMTGQNGDKSESADEASPAPPPAPPPPPPAPPAPAKTSSRPPQDDWEEIQEKNEAESDSSDDDYANSRTKRAGLASALFGGLTSLVTAVTPASPASPSPKSPPPAALQNLGGGDGNADRGALLSAIQGGARLKKASTVDKSVGITGSVIGDSASPAHISTAPSMPSPEPITRNLDDDPVRPSNPNRQSVDWYAGLAADQAQPSANSNDYRPLEATKEEDEMYYSDEDGGNGVQHDTRHTPSDTDEFDMKTSLRVRTLYPFEGQREVDLSFKENLVLIAHPAKDSESPWWYGMVADSNEKGWFPHSYVEEIHVTRAQARFAYVGQSPEELPFAEGDVLEIVDTTDPDWWKAEKAGAIFIVPASYLEIMDSKTSNPRSSPDEWTSPAERRGAPPLLTVLSPLPSFQPAQSSDLMSLPASASHRPRAASAASADPSDSSSEDSVLSWWSDDDSAESDTEVNEEKDAERKRREVERQKQLLAAGLQLRREPPGIPNRVDRKVSRRRPPPPGRRPAPGVPKQSRRHAPAVPAHPHASDSDTVAPLTPSTDEEGSGSTEPALELQDAYARYEQYLAQSNDRSAPLSGQPSGVAPTTPLLSPPTLPGALSPTASSHSLALPVTSSSSNQAGGGRLSGFFSRMMAPAISQEPARKLISGPISRIDSPRPADPSRPESMADNADIGKTWSSLVDPGVLESMSQRERKRQEAIFEFISTEATYNRDLQLIVEVFYASLLDMLDDKALTVIFANVEDILLANTSFYSSLEQRQKASRLYVDTIGDVLDDHMGNMGIYRTYCVNQQQAGKLLQSLRSSNVAMGTKLQSIRENEHAVRGLDLSSFLLIPMQRITRYPLLLKQIIHYTEPDQDLYAVQNALNTVEVIVAQINESVREADGQDRLRVLSEHLWIGGEGRLDLTAPTASQGPRRLIKEGTVLKAKSGRKLTLVLCNDILVLVEDGGLYRMPMPLFELDVRESRDQSGFALKVAARGGGDSVGLKAASPRDAKEWVGMIEAARLKSIDARSGGRGRGNRQRRDSIEADF